MGTEVDYVEAFKWFKKAAEEHHSEGQFLMGISYYEGIGVDANIELAKEYFELSYSNGNEKALEYLELFK